MNDVWERLGATLDTAVKQAVAVWIAGGDAMWAIALSGLVLFGLGMRVWLGLRTKSRRGVREEEWRRWIDRPREREGHLGRLLDQVTGFRTLADTAAAFQGLRTAELSGFERDLRVVRICTAVAPLLGLFGTVTGMLATFNALATGQGGDKTIGLIAKGISEALITTETGLVIALPGLFFQYQLSRSVERYRAFLAHLETVCTQAQLRRLRAEELAARRAAARAEVAAAAAAM
jgi:biopolymer transport protein ExbB